MALECFQGRDLPSLLVALKSCRDLVKGRWIQASAKQSGLLSSALVASSLINMYAKCGSMMDARSIFDAMPQRNVVSWTALILGYADNGEASVALELFSGMDCQPNARTLTAVLKACKLLGWDGLHKGRAVHSLALHHSMDDTVVLNTLIDLYAKLGRLSEAHRVFDGIPQQDVVSWTSLILGYVNHGEGGSALELFACMAYHGCTPSSVTFVSVLKACSCAEVEDLTKGLAIHCMAFAFACDVELQVASALVEMYGNLGRVDLSQRAFDRISHPSVVSWTSLILGYAVNGEGRKGLKAFAGMQTRGCVPDGACYVAAVKACCTDLASLRAVHSCASIRQLHSNVTVASCLVDLYGRCGCLVDAQRVFESVSATDTVAWTSLMGAYAKFGDADRVIKLLWRMTWEGLRPNAATFQCLLAACSHAGSVQRGKYYFAVMEARYGITPDAEHYTCMVDMLGRANELEAAVELVRDMPSEVNEVAWRTLLSASKKWKNVVVSRLATEFLQGV